MPSRSSHHRRPTAYETSSRWRVLASLTLLLTLVWIPGTSRILVQAEMQATWTPNEDEGPAMPLSMNQRQQLLQLAQAIQNSPDPNGTLQQVAQSNNMSPNDLYDMIEKNARDLQQDPALLSELQQYAQGGGGIDNSLPKMVLKMIAGLVVAIRQAAHQNPRAFSLMTVSALLAFYTLLAIPRTGLHVSSGRNLLTLSSGPTTIFSPPDRYLHKLIGKQASVRTAPKLSVQNLKKDWDDLLRPMIRELAVNGPNYENLNEDDGNTYGTIETHKLGRKSDLKQAITAQFVLEPDTLLRDFPLGETVEEIEAERDNIIDMLYSNAAGLLAERNLVEFSATEKAKERIRAVFGDGKKNSDLDSKDFGLVVVPGLGNLGRYGLMFWRATSETSEKSSASSPSSSSTLTLTTLKKKGFFDGQIHIVLRKIPQHDGMLVVQVSLAVPKGGRKIHKAIGEKLVKEMARSIILSASRRTKQRLSRQMQGKRFKDVGSRRANDRRNSRFERERLLEEMAADRRRRWQKSNPDAGHYRPSGHRMQSPNNC